MLKLSLIIFLISPGLSDSANDTFFYDQNSIYLYSDAWGEGFVKDNELFLLGRLGANLEKEISTSRAALFEIHEYQHYKKIAMITGFISATTAITETVLELTDTRYSNRRSISITLITSSVISGTISKIYNRLAIGAISRSVWLYNRDLIRK